LDYLLYTVLFIKPDKNMIGGEPTNHIFDVFI
jgi:hypothetical protein